MILTYFIIMTCGAMGVFRYNYDVLCYIFNFHVNIEFYTVIIIS